MRHEFFVSNPHASDRQWFYSCLSFSTKVPHPNLKQIILLPNGKTYFKSFIHCYSGWANALKYSCISLINCCVPNASPLLPAVLHVEASIQISMFTSQPHSLDMFAGHSAPLAVAARETSSPH